MKGYFVCGYGGPQWWTCYGILEGGFCFGQHVCSDPCFAPGDLYFRRADRISALEQVFGVTLHNIEWETIKVRSKADTPDWWESTMNNAACQGALAPKYAAYKAALASGTAHEPA